jgi:beta-exotoxin I transport system ATP-binding protein
MSAAIRTEQLSKAYGKHVALTDLDLEIEHGEVFGFLGPNGAGKTTTIRILLDLLRPTSGRAEVLGADPTAGGPHLRKRIGYLAGDFAIDGRQSAREALTFLGNLRGGVPAAKIEALADRFGLELDRRIKSLSKGNRQKVGLVQAFMHEPELLILDEPTSGLDPLVQQEFLTLVRETAANGSATFMSSHVLSEVQHVAQRVAIIRDGRLVTVDGVEELRERAVRRIEIHFADPVPREAFEHLPGVSDVELDGAVLRCRLAGSADPLVKAAARFTVVGLLAEEPDLEELFLGFYRDAA